MSLVTWEIHARGLFLCTPNPLGLHQFVRMSLILPTTGNLVVLHGMVVGVVGPDGADGRPPGMDVELYAIDATMRTAWWEMVRFMRDGADSRDPSSCVRVGGEAPEAAPLVTAARSTRAG